MTTLDAFPEAQVDPGLDLDRRYTTPETMVMCMNLTGVARWDLDVAADKESHWAEHWYDIERNGLVQPWFGNIWCNPPFSDIKPWVVRAWAAMTAPVDDMLPRADLVAMLLPANRTEQPWFQKWVEPMRDSSNRGSWSPFRTFGSNHRYATLRTHFLPTRVRYGHPGNPTGKGSGSPPFASMLLVWKPA